MRIFLLMLTAIITTAALGQTTFPNNGTVSKETVYTAFINATVYVDYQTKIENTTLVIRQGKVVGIGAEIELPPNTVVYDLEGKFIYPSFIDLYSDYGMGKTERAAWSPQPQYESNQKGAYGWNQSIRPEIKASLSFKHDDAKAQSLRGLGFGTVMTHEQDGIARGTSCVVGLGSNENYNIILAESAAHYSFSKGSSRQKYPGSLMGAIALLRQTYFDADWYASPNNIREQNISLSAWNAIQSLPQVFESGDKLNTLRADLIGDEFNVQYIFMGSGDEYQRLEDIKATGGAFILPINFPSAFDVSDPYLARMVSLEEMKHWELAPTNPFRLWQAGVEFALTTDGLSDSKLFMTNIRKAISMGLPEGEALKALTHTPAKLVGIEQKVGALKPGMEANFIISSSNLFEEKVILYENWVQGERFVMTDMSVINLNGTYNLNVNKVFYNLTVSGEPGKHKGSIELYKPNEAGEVDTVKVKVDLQQNDKLISLSFDPDDKHTSGRLRLAGNVNLGSRIWDGQGELPSGKWIEWVAIKQNDEEKKEETDSKVDSLVIPEVGAITYPLMAYGWQEKPKSETILIVNATIWTCEEEGIIENGRVLIHDGKIAAVGKTIDVAALFPKQTITPRIIDAKGKHVSPGIIDEHSHIAVTRGVNEGSQASSAEVQIGSVINSDDVYIYRHLAGGVTSAQLLHGSANPIGGQSGMIKLRWGLSPEEMKFDGAAPFIKFALGENVKQSNWGDYETERFPQTRMGVEQVYYDHFWLAREYGEEWGKYWDTYLKLTKRDFKRGDIPTEPRRDLEMECLLQILNSERFVTCHSYRQDEINMLMHVADSMDFRLNTFTHILEGYKVADKMKAHGAGASSFSDWWAYKYEVKDAIPYNGALLWEQGIVTAFNSDDREMARRLNQEAGKAVKYGGVPEEEALKFVTLNPAILLHVDHMVGSIKVGKDADIVIWSDNPLSIYAKAEFTFVDGICYYSVDQDKANRDYITAERARLIQLMLASKDAGETTRKPKPAVDKHYHCDTIYDEFEN